MTPAEPHDLGTSSTCPACDGTVWVATPEQGWNRWQCLGCGVVCFMEGMLMCWQGVRPSDVDTQADEQLRRVLREAGPVRERDWAGHNKAFCDWMHRRDTCHRPS